MISTATETRVTIIDVSGARQEFLLPVPPKEAVRSCFHIAKAREWIRLGEFLEVREERAVEVCIHRTGETITVRWHAVDETQLEAARQQLDHFFAGDQEEEGCR